MKSKILELARQRQKEGHKTFLSPDHKLPMSRREFLAAGLRDTAVFVAMPTIVDLLFSNTAQAAEIPPTMITMILDGSGGPGDMVRACRPTTSSGAMPQASALGKMGIAPGQQYTDKYGVPLAVATGTPGNFVNRLTVAPPTGGVNFAPPPTSTAPSLIQMASYVAITGDDNNQGLQNPTGLCNGYESMMRANNYFIQSGGAIGNGSNRALFGTNSQGPLAKIKANNWLGVKDGPSVKNAISFPGVLLKNGLAVKALEGAKTLVGNRMARMPSSASNMGLATQQKSGVDANLKNASEGQNVVFDPQVDLAPSTIAILDAGLGGAGNNENIAFKAALAAAVRGISLPLISVTLNGGDFHTGNTADEDAFNLRRVTMIRGAANECLLRNIKLVFSMIGDGSMNTGGALAYVSDEGRFSKHIVGVVSNTPVPVKKAQMGFSDATTGFAVAANSPFVDNNQILAASLFASMLAASGDANWLQNVRKVMPDALSALLTDEQLRALNAFA